VLVPGKKKRSTGIPSCIREEKRKGEKESSFPSSEKKRGRIEALRLSKEECRRHLALRGKGGRDTFNYFRRERHYGKGNHFGTK